MKLDLRPQEFQPKIVLAVGAHPDDIEFCAAGTIARWCADGVKVYYLILTDGSKGSADRHISSSDLINTRRREQQSAAKLLGVKEVMFFDYEDGILVNTLDLKRDITRIVRLIRPDLVLTMDPTMIYSLTQNYVNHPDHRAAGQAVIDVVFPLARDYLSFPELVSEGLEPHIVPYLLLVNFENNNFSVDITDFIDLKIKALSTHKSQISNPNFTRSKISEMAKEYGKANGCKYAENYIIIKISS